MRYQTSLALLLSLSAAACATPKMVKDNDPVATVADLHKIKVAQAGERLEASFSNTGVLSIETMAQVDAFGAAYRQNGHGALLLSTPAGAGDANAAAIASQSVRMALVDKGVPFAAISGATYDASGKADAPLVLSYMRYTAEAPECAPAWTVNLADTKSNQPYSTFGCFLSANIEAMVVGPADLEGPRASEPRDSARRDVVMDNYRKGTQTHAERTNDERVTISKAAAN